MPRKSQPPNYQHKAPADCLQLGLRKVLQGKDLERTSVGEIRKQSALSFGFAADGLDCRKEEVQKVTAEIVDARLSLEEARKQSGSR